MRLPAVHPHLAAHTSGRASRLVFLGVCGLLFALSAAATAAWCGSMSAMGGMPMPGGRSMSMMWMRVPGQTWSSAAASFIGMWIVMMAAMMLPSLMPTLWRYRQAVLRTGAGGSAGLTVLVALGYFFVWTLIGLGAFLAGTALGAIEMQFPALARAVPAGIPVVILLAGALQFTAWKARQLACCRDAPDRHGRFTADTRMACRHGLHLGLRCSYCCAGLTAILLVVGIMDLRAMALVTAATTIERLAPAGERVARAIGAVAIVTGLRLIAGAVSLG